MEEETKYDEAELTSLMAVTLLMRRKQYENK